MAYQYELEPGAALAAAAPFVGIETGDDDDAEVTEAVATLVVLVPEDASLVAVSEATWVVGMDTELVGATAATEGVCAPTGGGATAPVEDSVGAALPYLCAAGRALVREAASAVTSKANACLEGIFTMRRSGE